LNTARAYHTATLLPSGMVLVAGGTVNVGSSVLSSCELYDPSTGTWTPTGNLNTARAYDTATLLTNGKVLVAGGLDENNASLSSCEIYDPSTGVWTATASLHTARAFHTATLLAGGDVLATAGVDFTASGLVRSTSGRAVHRVPSDEDIPDDIEELDPFLAIWLVLARMELASYSSTANQVGGGQGGVRGDQDVSSGTLVLVTGGYDEFNNVLSASQIYDSSTKAWTLTGSLATARVFHTATLLTSGEVLAAGGWTETTLATSSCEVFTLSASATAPGAPTGVTAIAGNSLATVSFTAPTSTGGSSITGYTVTSSPGDKTASGAGSPITVKGLTNGTAYTFTVTAKNKIGTGPASSPPSPPVTPATVPGAPTAVTAAVTASNAEATVSFKLPANGGNPITVCTATSKPGGITGTGAGSAITVSPLTFGTAYTFTVTATNGVGTGHASTPSKSVTPYTVPGAPTIGTAKAGNGDATVSFTAPASKGGSAITSYTVTSSGGQTAKGPKSPITVRDLTNDGSYTFTVTAANKAGTGPASGASNSVTPTK
ncbi:MAG: kelch repeat-containing protein, partial [Syntrophobacteraceae bacterium]